MQWILRQQSEINIWRINEAFTANNSFVIELAY